MTKKLRIRENSKAVLEAAAKLFRLKGYAATTVRDIAQAAGILPGSLHYRYATKEDLLVAMAETAVTRAVEAIQTAVAATNDPLERLRLALVAHIQLLLSSDDTFFVVFHIREALTEQAQEALARLRARYEKLWDDLLREVIAAGRINPKIDFRFVRELSLGAVNWIARLSSPDKRLSAEDIAESFWSFLTEGLFSVKSGEWRTQSGN